MISARRISHQQRGGFSVPLTAFCAVMALGVIQTAAVPPASAVEPSEAPTFTLAQIPDTQREVVTENNPLLPARYQWLVNNRETLNIRFIAHSGDLVDWGAADPAQFTRASSATEILDRAGIPYAYAIGNHDTAAVGIGGAAAPGNVHDNLRNTTAFNRYFPLSRFKNVHGAFEPNKVDNLYQIFRAGGRDWLLLTHEMWPRQAVLDWAKQVVSAHPNHNVIINTHAYIDNRGLFSSGTYGDRYGKDVWEQLISQHANIKIVLSAHHGTHSAGAVHSYYSQVTGVHGNKIAQVMTSYHSSYQNHVRLLAIDAERGTISSSVYVNLSTRSDLPTGYVHDTPADDFVATAMSWIPSGNQAELLPDAGFERGNGGWTPFNVGTVTRVGEPVHGGSSALRVSAAPTTTDLVGLTQNSAVTGSLAGARYTARCFVRPTAPGLELKIRILEYTQNFGSHIKLNTTTLANAPAHTWTQIAVTGTATASGRRLIPQIYVNNHGSTSGSVVYDDCSLTIG